MSTAYKRATIALTTYTAPATLEFGFEAKSVIVTTLGAIPMIFSFDGINDAGRADQNLPKEKGHGNKYQKIWLRLETAGSQDAAIEAE